jgi:hypothetical protein
MGLVPAHWRTGNAFLLRQRLLTSPRPYVLEGGELRQQSELDAYVCERCRERSRE